MPKKDKAEKAKKEVKKDWKCKNCKSVWTPEYKVCANCGTKKK